MSENLKLKLLSKEEVGTILDKCIHFLSNKGIQVHHTNGLKILENSGAQVNFKTKQVKFSSDIIENALQSVPHKLKITGRRGNSDMTFPHPERLFYVRNNAGSINYYDPDLAECRNVTIPEVKEWAQITEALNNIDACCYLTPKDVPEQTADIHSLKTVFEYCSKPIMIHPHSLQSIEYLLNLSNIVEGYFEISPKQSTVAISACSTTPFVFKELDVEVIIQASRQGVPIKPGSLPSAGATAPVTIAGTVLVAGIEILALIVMSQLMKPGLPVIGSSNFYTLDMANGRNLKTSIEAITGTAAVVQFIKEAFGIPAQTHGFGTDSYIPDGQYMVQTSLQAAAVALSGCDLLSAAGRLNALSASSPVQLIIDDAIAGMLKRLKSGVKVDDDSLAFEDLLKIDPGGDFLRTDHTLKHCRDALRSDLFASKSLDQWNAEGRKDLYARAVEKYHELRGKESRQHLPKEVIAGMEEVVRKADKHLVK